MKIQSLFALLVVCAFAFLSVYPADAVIYGKRGDDEATIPWAEGIKHWDVGPGAQAEVVGSELELITDPKVTPGSISITPMSTLLS